MNTRRYSKFFAFFVALSILATLLGSAVFPSSVSAATIYTAISAGYYHTCALTQAGGVKCWGYNAWGQLGDGTTTIQLTPVDVVGLGNGVSAISAGVDHTCILTQAGGVKCWGHNNYGQLGDGTTTDRLTPVDVAGLASGVSAISAGWGHTCALTQAGGVKCWGQNTYGQLGDDTGNNQLTPVNVAGLTSGVSAVNSGENHTCTLTQAGGVKCWGQNTEGRLGDGTTTNKFYPVNVVGLTSGVGAISAGSYHTCALDQSSRVKCWGYNSSGQLGNGTTTNSTSPVDVTGLASELSSIDVGGSHVCVLTEAGGVKCWGRNFEGQVGDNTIINKTTPVDVFGLASGVKAISGGGLHTCALTQAGGIKCWGFNEDGELGDGTTTDKHIPVDVVDSGGIILTVSKSGTGSGTVTSNPAGINCGTTCSYAFAYNTMVTLMATPISPSTFVGWSGGCSGMDTCSVTMNAAQSVTATFNSPGSVYSISGRAVDGSGTGIPGVSISDGAGHLTTTSNTGDYLFTGLKPKYYFLAAYKDGLSFTPFNRPVTIVSGNITGQNFTGLPLDCSTATAPQPVFLVPGWGGSATSFLANDENLSYLYSGLKNNNYVEGCNLFYAQNTDPSKWLDQNGKIIQDEICRAAQKIVDRKVYPNWKYSFDVIGYSYGGLRARAYLEDTKLYGKCTINSQAPKVRNLITVGTPHEGDMPSLPLSAGLALNGLTNISNNKPALVQLLPVLRKAYNLSHFQPENVNYYLISGDSRTQPTPSSLIKWVLLRPNYITEPSDMAVHLSSGFGLGGYWLQYPRTSLMQTLDVHGRSSEPLAYGLNDMISYFTNSDTFNYGILPVISGNSAAISDHFTIVSNNQYEASESILDWVAKQAEPVTTPDMAEMDIISGVLTGTQEMTNTFEITSSGETAVMLAWNAGDVSLVLKDPSGAVVPQDSNYARFDGGFGWTIFYDLPNPPTGTWSYTITSQNLADPAVYRLAAMFSTSITVVGSLPENVPYNSQLILTAKVAYDDTTPVTGGTVFARIKRPDSLTETQVLYDDGNHQDGAANDGVFGGTYSYTRPGGIYGVLFIASGSFNGETYTRTATANFTVPPTSASLGSGYSNQGIDDDQDGIYEWLEISTPVTVNQAGTYMISGELYSGSVYIGQTYTEGTLSIGAQYLVLRFSGEDISEKKLNGPYALRNLMLFDETPPTLLIQAVDNIYTTGAYQYLQFAHVMISGNAGVGGATLSYNNGGARTATADNGGDYSFQVKYNWSGMVTPYFNRLYVLSSQPYLYQCSSRSNKPELHCLFEWWLSVEY